LENQYVAISYSASADKAAEVVKSIESAGQRGFAIKADHAIQSEVTALVDSAVKALGQLDILVNNAGISVTGSVTDPSYNTPEKLKEVERLWAINLTSVATAVRAAASSLPSGGRIINIGSILGQAVYAPGLADYSATKSALRSYTKGWARDFGPKGVTVNLIQPGHIVTDMNPPEGANATIAATAPAGRHGRPEEIAAAVLFIATPAASFVNAAVLTDGAVSLL
jgi:3-oxoacyl-[acyl-carrier protein] reductase